MVAGGLVAAPYSLSVSSLYLVLAFFCNDRPNTIPLTTLYVLYSFMLLLVSHCICISRSLAPSSGTATLLLVVVAGLQLQC